MMNKQSRFTLVIFLWAALVWTSCQQKNKQSSIRQRIGDQKSLSIIDNAIAAHGGERYQVHNIEFDFRGRHYISQRDHGIYTYERIFTDSTGQKVRDVLNNEGLVRYVDGSLIEITEEKKKAFSNSVNSVIYFALLPYFLNDPAVQATYIGQGTLENQPYEKIKVHFSQEGGGTDFQDEFIYWFHRDRHTLDYMAYNYQTEGGGSRFRKAIHAREVGGIRFADYINYKSPEETLYIMNFDSLFEKGALDSLSLIATENVVVK